MTTTIVGGVILAYLPGTSWWYWWRVTRRPLSDPQVEGVRTSIGVLKLAIVLFLGIAAINGVTAVLERDGGQGLAAGLMVLSVLASLPALVLAGRHLGSSRPGPSPDLQRRLARSRRLTLPLCIAVAALSGGLALASGESVFTAAAAAAGPALIVFMILLVMRAMIERSVRPRGDGQPG